MTLTNSTLVCTWISTYCDHRGDSKCSGDCLEVMAQGASTEHGTKESWEAACTAVECAHGMYHTSFLFH